MNDFEPHLDDSDPPDIPLPEGWPEFAVAAVLHVIAVARLAIMSARDWPGGGECDELRLRADNDRLAHRQRPNRIRLQNHRQTTPLP